MTLICGASIIEPHDLLLIFRNQDLSGKSDVERGVEGLVIGFRCHEYTRPNQPYE